MDRYGTIRGSGDELPDFLIAAIACDENARNVRVAIFPFDETVLVHCNFIGKGFRRRYATDCYKETANL